MSIFSNNKEKQDAIPSYTPTPQPTQPVQSNYQSSTSSSSNMTNISGGTIVDGQIKVEGDIKVEGTIKGTITSKGKVQVTSTGKVDGDIICQNADILMLKGSAVVDGDINTGKIIIESGVKFNGNCTMGVAAQAAAPQATAQKVEVPKPSVSNTTPLNVQS